MAVGIGSDSGLSGIFSVVKENFDIADFPTSAGSVLSGGAFSGGGQTLVLTASPGTRINNYQVRFIEPRVFNTPWQFDVSLYQHQRRFRHLPLGTDRSPADARPSPRPGPSA